MEATGTASPKKQQKSKCAFGECQDRVAKIIGFCKFCEKDFCSRHRTVESHTCEKLEACRKQHFDKNSNKLMNEKVGGSKFQQV
jgi:predicted nucleic acid binding AN1-type Zn finger protein